MKKKIAETTATKITIEQENMFKKKLNKTRAQLLGPWLAVSMGGKWFTSFSISIIVVITLLSFGFVTGLTINAVASTFVPEWGLWNWITFSITMPVWFIFLGVALWTQVGLSIRTNILNAKDLHEVVDGAKLDEQPNMLTTAAAVMINKHNQGSEPQVQNYWVGIGGPKAMLLGPFVAMHMTNIAVKGRDKVFMFISLIISILSLFILWPFIGLFWGHFLKRQRITSLLEAGWRPLHESDKNQLKMAMHDYDVVEQKYNDDLI